jgi:hypothetical protein
MKEELDNYLTTTYPKIFAGRYGGLAVGDGWFQIIRNLCQNIQSHIDWKNKTRQREIDKFIAREQGYEALCKFYSGERPATDWEIEQADETMQEGVVIPDEVPQVIVQQVKEKFGTLRFYYQGGDDAISGMVRMAESMSGVMCEECGAPGTTNSGGWIRTLCEQHEAEYQQRRKSND